MLLICFWKVHKGETASYFWLERDNTAPSSFAMFVCPYVTTTESLRQILLESSTEQFYYNLSSDTNAGKIKQ